MADRQEASQAEMVGLQRATTFPSRSVIDQVEEARVLASPSGTASMVTTVAQWSIRKGILLRLPSID